MMKILWISLFGVVGVLSRYGINEISTPWTKQYPWGTFWINMGGSFLAGLVFTLTSREGFSPEWRLALLVGFLGGFTTFSGFSLESARLLQRGELIPAFVYLIGSPMAGLVFTFLGIKAAAEFFLRS